MDHQLTILAPGDAPAGPRDGVLRHSFAVGRRYRCILTFDLAGTTPGAASVLNVQWQPAQPRRLNKREWREYRADRDAFMREVAEAIGTAAVVVEI